jgi:hypothetical protein
MRYTDHTDFGHLQDAVIDTKRRKIIIPYAKRMGRLKPGAHGGRINTCLSFNLSVSLAKFEFDFLGQADRRNPCSIGGKIWKASPW